MHAYIHFSIKVSITLKLIFRCSNKEGLDLIYLDHIASSLKNNLIITVYLILFNCNEINILEIR